MALRALNIYLDRSEVRSEQLPAAVEHDYLGGRGAVAWTLATQLAPDNAPLTPENILVFAAGPLAGTGAFACDGFVVGTHSPLTGAIGYGWAQGHWGGALRRAGHDLLVLKGMADDWSWIQIDGAHAAVLSATELLGLDTVETVQALHATLGEDYSLLCIGPAGEAGVVYSSIVAEGRYVAEPAGAAAIMAHKRIKAIAVRGGSTIAVPDPQKHQAALDIISRRAEGHPLAEDMRQFGSTYFLLHANECGALTGRNGQDDQVSRAIGHIRSSLALRGQKTSRGCVGCPMPCYSDYVRQEQQVPRPELELVAGFGARCGISNPDSLIILADKCLRLGLDPTATSAAVAFMMECQQRDLNPLDTLPWGNSEAVIAAVERLGQQQEKRDVLSLGVGEMQEIFWGSAAFAPQVKGLALPGLDPRAMQELALTMATSPIGGDYRYAMAYEELLEEPPRWLPNAAVGPRDTEGKVLRLIWHERFAAALDAAGMCRRLGLMGYQVTPAELIALVNAATGRVLNGTDLARLGERIITLERRFLYTHSFGDASDALRQRWSETPLKHGPAANTLPALDTLLPEYYRRHGWDQHGNPTPQRLSELGIS